MIKMIDYSAGREQEKGRGKEKGKKET